MNASDDIVRRLERLEQAVGRVERAVASIAATVLGISPDAPGAFERRPDAAAIRKGSEYDR